MNISLKLQKNIRKLVTSKVFDAYAFRWPIYDGKKYVACMASEETKQILLRKKTMYYVAMTHQGPNTYGKAIERKDLTLEHKPSYNNYTFDKLMHKWLKWKKIHAKEIMNLENLDTFNIKDKKKNDKFKRYRLLRRFPILVTSAFVCSDLIKRIFSKNIFKYTLFDWRIALFHYIEFYYLAIQLDIYKIFKPKLQQ